MNNTENNLPADIDVERYLLGSLLLENSSIDQANEILNENCFTDNANKEIYRIINDKYEKGIPVDNLVLYDEVKKRNLLDLIPLPYISKLSNEVSSTAHTDYHSKILFEKWIYRELIKRSQKIVDKAKTQSEDPFDLINKAEDIYSGIMDEVNKIQPNTTLWDGFYNFLQKIDDRATGKEPEGLLSQTFPSFNRMTGAMQDGDLITIYGSAKSGKTTLSLQICLDVALNLKLPVAMFSLEMSAESIFNKSASMRGGIDYRKLRSPKVFGLTPEEFKPFMDRARNEFEGTQFFVYDQIFDRLKIKAKMKELKSKFDVKLFCVDYISLIHTSERRERRDLEIADLSRYFKLLAKELKTPILMLSQANDNGDTSESKALLKDSDFLLLVQKPIEQGIFSIKKKDGGSLNLTEEHFLVTLKKSRHTINLSQFICKYVENNFVELDLNN